jgi:hypothetical protein
VEEGQKEREWSAKEREVTSARVDSFDWRLWDSNVEDGCNERPDEIDDGN